MYCSSYNYGERETTYDTRCEFCKPSPNASITSTFHRLQIHCTLIRVVLFCARLQTRGYSPARQYHHRYCMHTCMVPSLQSSCHSTLDRATVQCIRYHYIALRCGTSCAGGVPYTTQYMRRLSSTRSRYSPSCNRSFCNILELYNFNP
jgi:hypothetical protein